MLKKAGIVVAATAAGLLAFGPLAFAGEKGDPKGDDKGDHGYSEQRRYSPSSQINFLDNGRDSEQDGLVNVGDVNALNDVNVCPGVPAAVGIGNLLGLLGDGATESEADGDDITCENDDSITQVNDR